MKECTELSETSQLTDFTNFMYNTDSTYKTCRYGA